MSSRVRRALRLGQGQGGYLEGAARGFDEIGLDFVANIEAGDFQGVEDFYCGGAAHGVGQVVVADEEEDGDAGGGKGGEAAGELPLLGLVGVAAFVGVTGEEDEVGFWAMAYSTSWSRAERKSRRRVERPVSGSVRL